MAAHTLVIKVTAGKDEPERCGQALTVAATAIASGVDVSLWLAAEAAWLALPGRADDIVLPHSPPLADLLASIVAGGRVTLCTQCAARREADPVGTAASRCSRSRCVHSSSPAGNGGSGPAAQVSSRSARPGLRTSTGPCR